MNFCWARYALIAFTAFLLLGIAETALPQQEGAPASLSIAEDRPGGETGFWLSYQPRVPEGFFYTFWPEGHETPLLDWRLPSGLTLGSTEWPQFHKYEMDGRTVFGFEPDGAIRQEILIPEAAPESPLEVSLSASLFVCTEECRPLSEQGRLEITRQTLAALDPDTGVVPEGGLISRRELVSHANAGTNDDFTFAVNFRGEDKSPYVEAVYFLPTTPGVVREGQLLRLRKSTADFYKDAFKGYLGSVPMAQGAESLERISGMIVFDLGNDRPIEAFPASVSNDYRKIVALGPVEEGSEEASLTFPLALLSALLGGIILNLMPCVLPVLSLKVFSFMKAGTASRAVVRRDGYAYSAGVVLSFAAVGGILIGLRSIGDEVGWGFQLQSPPFVLAMSLLLFALGLNFLGVFEIAPGRLAGIGQKLTERKGPAGAFSTGVLATIVATPCTAPFMASALVFALAQPPVAGLMIFVALGAGLALPYLVLSLVPALGRFLAKPGPWMSTFKQFLAFPLFGTVIWLLWTLSIQTGPRGVLVALSALFALAFGIWLWKTLRRPVVRKGATVLLVAFALAPIAFSGRLLPSQGGPDGFQSASIEMIPYSEAELERLQAKGRPVFLHFWAAWCPVCIMHEQFVFKTSAFQDFVAEHDVAFMYIDNTIYTPKNVRLMESFGRSGQPIDVFFVPGKEPLVMPELYNASYLINTLEKALD